MTTMENIRIVLQFVYSTLLPVLVSWALVRFDDRLRFERVGYWRRQIFYGIVFGVVAISATEFGIDTQDATMNVRDAAPLVAGFYFGSPAGIIAGMIGGVERWFSVYWGRGMFTRLGCSLATFSMGFAAAFLNWGFLEHRKPGNFLALIAGMFAEILHLFLVLLTNLDEPSRALSVVKACSIPMTLCSGIAVALSGIVISLAKGENPFPKTETHDISQVIQKPLFCVVVVGLIISGGITSRFQRKMSYQDMEDTLILAISDVEADTRDDSDENLLAITRSVARDLPSVEVALKADLSKMAKEHGVSEIYIVDRRGIIVASNEEKYIGFDMSSGEQSAAFLELLPSGRGTYHVQDYGPIAADSSVWRKFAGARIKDGFVQVSYDADLFRNDLASKVRRSVTNCHVGHNGFMIVFSDDGTLVGTRVDAYVPRKDSTSILSEALTKNEEEAFKTTLNGEPYYAMRRDVEGFHFVAMLPVQETAEALEFTMLIMSYMLAIVFATLFAVIYILIRLVVVRSIWDVNDTLHQITSGNLEARVDVRGSTEFASLSDDINETVGALREAIAAEGARIEADLATASAIQSSALPQTFPPFPDVDAFDIYASMNPAREVGGDFYDFFLIDDHTLGFLIADVSGKGIPASLFMMAAKSELSNYMRSGMDLAEALQCANQNLCRGNDSGMFVTVWAATLDYETGNLVFVNAGHNPPLLRHGGSWSWIKQKGGLFLGTFDTARYRSASIVLEPSDELLLYTDGVNEAFSPTEEQYGDERLESFLASHASLHPHVLIDELNTDLRQWANGAEQSDDITMLCLEYGVEPEKSGEFFISASETGLDDLQRRMHYELSYAQCPSDVQSQIDIVVEYLIKSAYTYAYRNSGEGDIRVAYRCGKSPDAVVISVSDWGKPFNALISNDLPNAATRMDDIAYIRDGEINVVAFRKTW